MLIFYLNKASSYLEGGLLFNPYIYIYIHTLTSYKITYLISNNS